MFSHDGYEALHEGAALLDRRAERGRIELRGADRRAYLHGLLTNDVAGLAPGTGCYAALLTPQGRMISDMRISELRDRLVIDLPAATTTVVSQRLADFIFSEDVDVQDISGAIGQWGLYGPGAAEVAAAIIDEDSGGGASPLPDLPADQPPLELRRSAGALAKAEAGSHGIGVASIPPGGNVERTFQGRPVVLVRSDDFGVDGFEILVEQTASELLRQALIDLGARLIDGATADVARVEAGRPAFGRDMDATTIPLEAGIEDRAISLTKGCYVGQEIIIRVLHRGQGRVAKRLVGVVAGAGDGPLSPGMRLASGGREIGSLTSAVDSPRLRRPIALGYVHRDFSEPGHVLEVRHGDAPVRTVTVVGTPFIQPAAE